MILIESLAFFLHASEQYFTSLQFFAHALRQVMSRPHCTQGLLGKLDLLPLNEVFEFNGLVTQTMTIFAECSSMLIVRTQSQRWR